ncbi:unnamed protein product, partial [Allacma fusca]
QKSPLKLSKFSRQDLTALALPSLLLSSMSAGAFIVDFFKMKTHLYHAFPPASENGLLHVALFSMDYLIGVFWVSAVIFVLELQVLLFEKTTCSLEGTLRELKESRHSDLQKIYLLCRDIELTVQLANYKFSSVVYVLKQMCLSIAVFNGCYAIRYLSERPIFAILYGLISFDCVVIFAVIFEKAFRIPMCMRLLKGEIIREAKTELHTARFRSEKKERPRRNAHQPLTTNTEPARDHDLHNPYNNQ